MEPEVKKRRPRRERVAHEFGRGAREHDLAAVGDGRYSCGAVHVDSQLAPRVSPMLHQRGRPCEPERAAPRATGSPQGSLHFEDGRDTARGEVEDGEEPVPVRVDLFTTVVASEAG